MKVQGMLPFLLLSLVAGIVFGLVWVLADDMAPEGEPSQAQRRSLGEAQQSHAPGEGAQSEGNTYEPSVFDTDQSASETGQHGAPVTASLGSFFLPQKVDATGSFVLIPQPVTWSASCANKPQLRAFTDLKEYVRQTHPLILTPIPLTSSKADAGVDILHLNQFFRDKDNREFLQYSIVKGADLTLGSGYRIERYRFRDEEMNEILGSEVLLPVSRRFDLDGPRVRAEFQKIMDALKPPRYLAGARILIYTASNLPVTGAAATRANQVPITATIEMTGGLITGYSTADISCESQLLANGEASPTVCECLLSSEAGNGGP